MSAPYVFIYYIKYDLIYKNKLTNKQKQKYL